jgi:hypothetical protein
VRIQFWKERQASLEALLKVTFEKELESKIQEQRDDLMKQAQKTLLEFDQKIQKEKNEIVLERQRIKQEMEFEYSTMNHIIILIPN